MSVQQHPRSEALPITSPMPPRREPWSVKRLIQVGWVMLTLLLLVIFFANIPAFYRTVRTGCTLASPVDCATGLLTTGNFQALTQFHLSVTVAASFLATLTLVVAVLYWVVGLLIFWRKSQEWAGLFFSFLFVLLGATGMWAFPGTTLTPQLIQSLTESAAFVLNIAIGIFLVIFPTGRFTPRWTWIVSVLFLLSSLPFVPGILSVLANFLPVGAQIYRYVRVYDTMQRQQTKWFVFGFSVAFTFLAMNYVLTLLVPGLSVPDSWYQLLNALTWPMVWIVLLLSVSIPILRYRLWDIDVIINRTLVYGSLTVLLVIFYIGLILALQFLVRVGTGSLTQQQPLVLVGSTLVIATLFQPLRSRLQTGIDRRFYRHKYDVSKVVAAFESTLRQEVNLDQLRERLLAVVQETMQPVHVSLWIRTPDRADTFSLHASHAFSQEGREQEGTPGQEA